MCIAHTSTPLTAEGLGTPREPRWLTDIPATVELIAAAEVAVIGFFQVCDTPHLYTAKSGTLGLVVVKPGAWWASDVDLGVRGHASSNAFRLLSESPSFQSSLSALCMRSFSRLLHILSLLTCGHFERKGVSAGSQSNLAIVLNNLSLPVPIVPRP